MTGERDHIEEPDAALFALGALDDPTRAGIDRHAAGCEACSRLLGAAEHDVALMAEAEPAHAPPALAPEFRMPRTPTVRAAGWPVWAALAAALIVAILPTAYLWRQNHAMHVATLADAGALSRLAGTSVRSAAFRGMAGGSTARVMYAPDGSWYVVLVSGASKALAVVWMHDGRRTMLGAAQLHGDVAMLYLPKSHRMDRLALLDGERVVAEAQLAY
ncbi:MAG: hypothetical protein ABI231_09275 [Candidatus Tumulicola sp.]